MTYFKDNINHLFNKLNKLKINFKIKPEINTIDLLKENLDKIVHITHLLCNYQEEVILKEWLNIQNRSAIDIENTGICFCTSCLNKFKTNDLREHLSNKYNHEFTLVSDFTGYENKMLIKHECCGATFEKTPHEIKATRKRIFCTHCKKSDSIYEKEMINKRNHELKIKFKENNIEGYTPIEDCMGFTKKMKFNHSVCGKDFIATAYDVYTNYGKHNHCPNCFKNKNKITPPKDEAHAKRRAVNNLKAKYRKFIEYSREFSFYPEINSFEDFKNHSEDIFSITHKNCNTTVSMTFSDWSKQRHYRDFDNTQSEFIHFCEHCSEILNRKDIQDYIDKNFNKEFRVKSKYRGAKRYLDIEHIACGNIIPITPSNLKKNKLHCDVCGRKDEKTEATKQKKRNEGLHKRLKNEGLTDFIPMNDYTNLTTVMKFKHTRCGSTVSYSLQNLIRLKNTRICNGCPEKLLNSEMDEVKRRELAQKALELNGNSKFTIIGAYDTDNDFVLLKHNDCLKEFPHPINNIFSKEIICPHCESGKFKNNRFISINEKIKAFEQHLNNEYEILKPFLGNEETVPFRHKACGYIFERTVSMFLRSQNKLFCPECRRQERLKDAQRKLQEKFNGEFEFEDINEYKTNRDELNFVHKECDTVFKYNLEKILSCKTTPCPTCSDMIKNEERFRSELYKKHKGEYILLGKFESTKKKTSFRHKKCNRLFVKNPYDVLNSDTPCTHCVKESKMLGIKEAQKKVYENSGDLFKLNGIYRGIKKDIPVTCNSCGGVFISTPKKMFLKKKCPICKAREIKKD